MTMPELHPWRMQWTNFRGYENGPQIELPAMTILLGRNNVGKTSAYSPLLLLRQTLAARNPETALLFRGDLVDFGSYEDVVTDHDTSRHIAMSLDFGPIDTSLLRIFGTSKPDAPAPRVLQITFSGGSSQGAQLQKSSVIGEDGKPIVSRTLQSNGQYRVVSSLLPKRKEVGRPLREIQELTTNLAEEKPNGFFFTGVSGIRLPASWRQDEDRWKKVQGWYRACSDLYDTYSCINYSVSHSLRHIAYLGPLRSAPRRSYLLSAEPPLDIGRDGQWAPEVLYQAYERKNSDVLEQVNRWLVKLGYGELSFESLRDYFQVFVNRPKSSVAINLADCGAGLSQLLPLLVQGCVMEAGDTLIAQQPEIHLNPAQQDLVTDFLIELCGADKRVIVETHSEHVLGRLRRRIAEGESISNEQVALYFSESANNRSQLRRIGISRWGEVSASDWPEGFFGEQLENSLKTALAQSRRKASEDRKSP